MTPHILFLGSANSIHLVRWLNSLHQKKIKVGIATMGEAHSELDPEIPVYQLPIKNFMGYFFNCAALEKIIERVEPDLIHAHYASGYGTLIRRTAPHLPVILSVWGSDIFTFPKKSIFHKKLICKNLNFASLLTSSSEVMKQEALKYTDRQIEIVPFGVDLSKFKPVAKKPSNSITIGTIKTMHPFYGIDILIKAFAKLIQMPKNKLNLRLVIGGSGPFLKKYQNLADRLGLRNKCHFLGAVSHHQVPSLLNQFDIFCAFSRQESFGVAVLEAAACGLPVVVSSAPGLKETTWDGRNGIVLKKNTPEAAAAVLRKLIVDSRQRKSFGREGRKLVSQKYSWSGSVAKMLAAYKSILPQNV